LLKELLVLLNGTADITVKEEKNYIKSFIKATRGMKEKDYKQN